MAFVLLISGAILLIAAVRNTQGNLFTLLQGDFTGQSNFIYWIFSLLVIGALGYIPKLKPISTAFLALVILVLFITRGDPTKATGGFFQKLTAQLGTTQTAATTTAPVSTASTIPTGAGVLPSLSQVVNLLPIQ